MEVLKRSALAAALLMLGLGATTAQAQVPQITCQASAVPPVVRAEGIAELTGDIIIQCGATGGDITVAPANVVTNLSVALNVNVTNNINFGAGSTVTDSVLVINENNGVAPVAAGSTFVLSADVQDPQFGTLAAPNRLEWNQVSIPFPGAANASATGNNPGTTTIRVTSIRGNASQLGVPDTATFPSTQITAFVAITGPTTIPVNNNVLNVAVPLLGLLVDVGDPIGGLQCVDGNEMTVINLREGFATSFKTIGIPTFNEATGNTTQWESGYFAPGSNNGGGASQATQFSIRFFNIPEGVMVYVPVVVDNAPLAGLTSDALAIELVSGADGTDPALPGLTKVTISGGFGQVIYETIDGNPFLTENIDVKLQTIWEADTANDLPAEGVGQVSASFAPLSTVTTASLTAPEPRFLDTSGDPDPFVSIVKCTSVLLFPFVTNQAGFDTGFAISNTSLDWLGTGPQDGTCTLHFHGETTGGGAAPADQTSTVIAAGEQLLFTLSGGNATYGIAGAPEFQGYIIAVCDFQFAHGYAFITDGFGGIPALAQGYLALVIERDSEGNRALTNGSESLGH